MVTEKVDGRQGKEGGKQGLKEPGWAFHGVGNSCSCRKLLPLHGKGAEPATGTTQGGRR